MDLSLHGKTAVICGSSQGLGLASARELALLGANCILIARNKEKLENAVNSLGKTSSQKHSYKIADFFNSEEVRNTINEILREGPVHILVNNSGGPPSGIVSEAKEEEFTKAFNQHLINNHILATAVIPGMKKEGFGRILNIISTSVKIPLSYLGVSGTVRAAVATWGKLLSHDLGQFNITVNNVLPGYNETERLESLIASNAQKKNITKEEAAKEMYSDIPMKRFGKPEEFGAVVAFLASPAASYVNGASIPVDGGRSGAI
jgi:3-oxoacyl-[acyl-carrier protein] reductase